MQNKLAQAIFRSQQQAAPASAISLQDMAGGLDGRHQDHDRSRGRICALPLSEGSTINNGDDIAFVEAMKMEIPVASTASGKLKSLLVKIDDVVAEDQVVASSRPERHHFG